MSGGSYDYLFGSTDLDDLLRRQHHLREMADRLSGLDEAEFPGCTAAARATQRLVHQLDLWNAHVEAQAGLLSDVWQAVEWWDSNDWTAEQVKEAFTRLLEPAPSPPASEAASEVLAVPEWKAPAPRLVPPTTAAPTAPTPVRPAFRPDHRDPWPTDDSSTT